MAIFRNDLINNITKSGLQRLNSLPSNEAEADFRKCCGSKNWAQRMASERPFTSFEDLIAAADRTWWSLKAAHWLEAFRGHPRIGEKEPAEQTSSESQHWSSQEQASISDAIQDIMQLLAELNRHYEEKFGYIYIVCATGKTSEEMLEILRERLHNDPEKEIRVAAEEQARITKLRLKRLLEP